MSAALVTGASSGIGRATARYLAEHGQEVFGLARRAQAVPAGVTPVGVDLGDPAAVARAFDETPRLSACSALVHSAGLGDFAPVELTSRAEALRQLEVNLLAAADLATRLLPGMRAARAGRIVFVSSVAADFGSPMGGWYHASKAALERLADSLRQEVAGFGVCVSLVRPGVVRTPWHDTALGSLRSRADGTPYAQMAQATATYHAEDAARLACEVEDVVAAVWRAVTSPRPRTRYLVGPGARVATVLPRLVGDRPFDLLTRRRFGIR